MPHDHRSGGPGETVLKRSRHNFSWEQRHDKPTFVAHLVYHVGAADRDGSPDSLFALVRIEGKQRGERPYNRFYFRFQ
jgi:hypothetical protein